MQGPEHGAARGRVRSSRAPGRARGPVSLALALALHALLAAAATHLASPSQRDAPALDPVLVWIDEVARVEAPPRALEAPLEVVAPASLSSPRRATRLGRVPLAEPHDTARVALDAVSAAADAPHPGDGLHVPEVPPAIEAEVPRVIDLDPRHVARALVLEGHEGPAAPPQSGPSTEVRALGEREAEALLSGDLGRRAMAKAYVTPRRPIRLSPHPDGTFTYDGSGFDATIRPDGTVVFRDRDDATIDTPTLGQTQPMTDVTGAPLESAPLFRDVPIAGIQVGGTLDGDSALARARGEDPHRFERERFMEETEELRARLEDEARAHDRARWRRRRPDAGPE